MTLVERLEAIESLLTAAPPAVSVDTLIERVRLGGEAKVELARTLRPWGVHKSSPGSPDRFHRYSAGTGESAALYVPEGAGETRYILLVGTYAHPSIRTKIDCDPADTERVKQLADVILAIAGHRLE